MLSLAPTAQQIECAIRELPAAPRILAQLAAHLQAADIDIAETAAVVKRDAALAALLINTANSVAFGGYEAATTLEEAVARLGFRETYRVILDTASSRLASRALPVYHIDARRLRENSLFCALMMEELCPVVGADPSTAYTIGLLRSVGKVILDRLARPHRYASPFEPILQPVDRWETENWAVTSQEVSAMAFEIWGFPTFAVSAVREHLQPTSESPREAHLLHLAASIADLHGTGLPGESSYWRSESEACRALDIDPGIVSVAAEKAAEIVLHVSPAFA